MRIVIAMLMLGACTAEPQAAREERPAAPAAGQAAPQPQPGQSSMLMSVPEDPEALKKLVAMGYTVHDDHLHAPGVTACPKMGEDPVV
ncbi:MAG TPA: hypothetical protein VFU20_00890 [Sphingomicrobium sp.]|nr:hypothetical protein [Sphingomicrobium sp.]